jgi:hypothetical protein
VRSLQERKAWFTKKLCKESKRLARDVQPAAPERAGRTSRSPPVFFHEDQVAALHAGELARLGGQGEKNAAGARATRDLRREGRHRQPDPCKKSPPASSTSPITPRPVEARPPPASSTSPARSVGEAAAQMQQTPIATQGTQLNRMIRTLPSAKAILHEGTAFATKPVCVSDLSVKDTANFTKVAKMLVKEVAIVGLGVVESRTTTGTP